MGVRAGRISSRKWRARARLRVRVEGVHRQDADAPLGQGGQDLLEQGPVEPAQHVVGALGDLLELRPRG